MADLCFAPPFRVGREPQVARPCEQSQHAGPEDLGRVEARLERAAHLILSLTTPGQRAECLKETVGILVLSHDASIFVRSLHFRMPNWRRQRSRQRPASGHHRVSIGPPPARLCTNLLS